MEAYQIPVLDSRPAQTEITICLNCQAHFRRPLFESWRRLCASCAHWLVIGRNLERNQKLFKELAQ